MPSGRSYIGCSAEVEKRLYLHVVLLNNGRHHCRYLQNIWRKHGVAEFAFYLLERCNNSRFVRREQHHMDAAPPKKLVNAMPADRQARGFKYSNAAKRKMRASALRAAADPAERLRRSARAKAQHAAGKLGAATWTAEGRRRIKRSASRIARRIRLWEHGFKNVSRAVAWTTERRAAAAQRQRGKKASKATRTKIARAICEAYERSPALRAHQRRKSLEVVARPGERKRRARRARAQWRDKAIRQRSLVRPPQVFSLARNCWKYVRCRDRFRTENR